MSVRGFTVDLNKRSFCGVGAGLAKVAAAERIGKQEESGNQRSTRGLATHVVESGTAAAPITAEHHDSALGIGEKEKGTNSGTHHPDHKKTKRRDPIGRLCPWTGKAWPLRAI